MNERITKQLLDATKPDPTFEQIFHGEYPTEIGLFFGNEEIEAAGYARIQTTLRQGKVHVDLQWTAEEKWPKLDRIGIFIDGVALWTFALSDVDGAYFLRRAINKGDTLQILNLQGDMNDHLPPDLRLPPQPKVEAFLKKIAEVCREFHLSLSHEDTQGGFEVHDYDPALIEWLLDASDETGKEVK